MSPRAHALVAGTCAALLTLALACYAWPYTVDDAYLIARIARNLVRGRGLVMNVGGPRVDGVTEPLWLVPVALGEAIAGDGIVAAKLAGIACATTSAFRTTLFVAERSERGVVRLVAFVLGIAPSAAIAAVSGLGTALAGCLFTEAWLAASHRPAARAGRAGGMLFLLAFTRPELVPACLVGVGFLHARDRRAGRIAGAAFVAGLVAVLAYRLGTFGHPLPLAALAKPSDLAHGLPYALAAILATGLASVLVGAFVTWPVLLPEGRALALGIAVHVVAVVLAGGDWMPGYRLFVPVLPACAALLGLVAEGARSSARPTAFVALGTVGLAVLLPLSDAWWNLPSAHASGADRALHGPAIAKALHDRCHRVALVDAGFLAYASGVEVVDLAGLVDPDVARLPGGHLDKRVDPLWLATRDPDCILLHSSGPPRVDEEGRLRWLAGYGVERRVASMPFVVDEFRVAGTFAFADDPPYDYVLLSRRAP